MVTLEADASSIIHGKITQGNKTKSCSSEEMKKKMSQHNYVSVLLSGRKLSGGTASHKLIKTTRGETRCRITLHTCRINTDVYKTLSDVPHAPLVGAVYEREAAAAVEEEAAV